MSPLVLNAAAHRRSSARAVASRVRRGAWTVMLIALMAAPFVATVRAAEPDSGVAFLDPADLTMSIGGPTPNKTAVIWLVNGGPTPAILELRVVSATGPAEAPTLALDKPPSSGGVLARSAAPVGRGVTWSVDLAFASAAPGGTYSGLLVALSDDGSHATRKITVSVAGPAPAAAIPPNAFAEPLPDPLTLHAERGPIANIDGSWLTTPSIDLVPDLAHAAALSPLVSSEGRLLAGTIDASGSIRFDRAPVAGTYAGVLSKAGADGKPTKLTTVSVTVRDFFLWPLLVLFVGFLAAVKLESWFASGAPRMALEAALKDLQARSAATADATARAIEAAPKWAGSNRSPVRLIQVVKGKPAGLLATASQRALEDFDDTPSSDTRTERWGAHGTELSKVEGYLEVQAELDALGDGINASYASLAAKLGDLHEDFNASGLANDVRATLAGTLVSSAARLEAIAVRRRSLAERVSKADQLADILVRLRSRAADRDQPAIQRLERRLANLSTGSLEEITAIGTDAQAIWNDVAARSPDEERIVADADEERFESLAFALTSFFAPDTGGGFGPAEEVEPTPAELRERLARSNQLFLAVAGVLAIAAPFGTLYLANLAFGTLADYVGLLVWGLTATVLAQYLRYASGSVIRRAERSAQPSSDGDVSIL